MSQKSKAVDTITLTEVVYTITLTVIAELIYLLGFLQRRRISDDEAQTATEVSNEISKLKRRKKGVPKRSVFGDDNIAAIDAQLDVLSGKLTESDIWERSGDDLELCNDEWTESMHHAAMDALDWKNGNQVPSPSENWA